MKITSNSINSLENIRKLERLYKQPGVKTQEEGGLQEKPVEETPVEEKTVGMHSERQTPEDSNTFFYSAKEVLSHKEVEVLNALFGFDMEGKALLYGGVRLKRIHSGMLIDVKG